MNTETAEIADVCLVLPVRQRPEHVVQALDSVMGGKTLPEHWIVVVDGTPVERQIDRQAVESWWTSCQDGLRTNFHFEILESPGRGPAHARNLGARHCQSEWIAFLDSDDLWEPEHLETQLSYLKARPFLHGCQTRENWVLNGKPIQQKRELIPGPGRFLVESLERCLIAPSAVLLRRSRFVELGGFDESFPVCEDYEFWLRYLDRYSMGLVDHPLTTKRGGAWHQLSRSNHSLDYHRCRALIQYVEWKGGPDRLHPGLLEQIQQSYRQKAQIVTEGAHKRAQTNNDRPQNPGETTRSDPMQKLEDRARRAGILT